MAFYKRFLAVAENAKYTVKVFDWIDTSGESTVISAYFEGDIIYSEELGGDGHEIGGSYVKCRLVQPSSPSVDFYDRLVKMNYAVNNTLTGTDFRPLYIQIYDATATTTAYYRLMQSNTQVSIQFDRIIYDLTFYDGMPDLFRWDYVTTAANVKIIDLLEDKILYNTPVALSAPSNQFSLRLTDDFSGATNTITVSNDMVFNSALATEIGCDDLYIDSRTVDDTFDNIGDFCNSFMQSFFCTITTKGLGAVYIDGWEDTIEAVPVERHDGESPVGLSNAGEVKISRINTKDDFNTIDKNRDTLLPSTYSHLPGYVDQSFLVFAAADGSDWNIYSDNTLLDPITSVARQSGGTTKDLEDLLADDCFDYYAYPRMRATQTFPTYFSSPMTVRKVYTQSIGGKTFKGKPVRIERSLTQFLDVVEFIFYSRGS